MNRVVSRWIVVTSNGGSGSSRPGNHARGSWSFPACLGAHYCPTESRGMTLDPHREQRNRNREHRLLRTLNGDSSVVHPSSIEALCAFHALLSRTCISVARSNISREADLHLPLVIIIIIIVIITIIVTLNWFTTSERPANELIAPPEGRGSRNDLPSLTSLRSRSLRSENYHLENVLVLRRGEGGGCVSYPATIDFEIGRGCRKIGFDARIFLARDWKF